METQPPKDLAALRRITMQLKAEVARLGAIINDWKTGRLNPLVAGGGRRGDSDPQAGARPHHVVIDAPGAATVEVGLPGGKSEFHHMCHMCRQRFRSSVRRPKQCRHCGSHRWGDGMTVRYRRRINPTD